MIAIGLLQVGEDFGEPFVSLRAGLSRAVKHDQHIFVFDRGEELFGQGIGWFWQVLMPKALVLQSAVVTLGHVEGRRRVIALDHRYRDAGDDRYTRGYQAFQRLAKDLEQAPIGEGALESLFEVSQPGKEESIEGGIHRVRLDRPLALRRCRHETSSLWVFLDFTTEAVPFSHQTPSEMWVKSRKPKLL